MWDMCTATGFAAQCLELRRLMASLFSSVHSACDADIQLYYWLIEAKEFVDENVK